MKLYLAPIMGVTDVVYRETFANYFTGVDCAITPFISSVSSRKTKPNYLKDIFPERNKRLDVVPQVLSNNAEDFLYIAAKIEDLGYTEINWNLGCPAPMVANKKRGSGLLPYPDQIDQILDQLCGKWAHSLSVKTRLGRVSSEEIFVLLDVFNRYPLKEVIIHPRLGVQLYNGDVDLDIFGQCLPLTEHQIVYNGDITTVDSYMKIQQMFPGIDNMMIGRGLLKNPFLAQMCKEKKSVQQLNSGSSREILLLFHNELFSQYESILFGPSHLLNRMKAIWTYFGHIFTDSQKIVKIIHKCTRVDQYQDNVLSFFETKALACDS